MENQIYILVIEDELEVMEALVNDLEDFEENFPVESANNAEEAKKVADHIVDSGNELGLILCDHVLPGKNGVDFMVELQQQPDFKATRKVLVTGQAGLEDTVHAINQAKLDYYIAKPWTKESLSDVVVDQLTDYVIRQNYNPMEYMSVLDNVRLADALRSSKPTDH